MNYQYTGKKLSGQKISGKVEADSKQEAIQTLEKDGHIIIDIAETKPWNKDIILNRKVKNKDFVIFLRQYSTLIRAGISLSDATKTMVKQTDNYALRVALTSIDKQLDNGRSLSVATEQHPMVFPSLLRNMIHAGEVSGKLDEILNQMADYYEKEYRNKQKIVSAVLYPTVVGIITLFLSTFLLVFVVPQFVSMFRSFGEEIPMFTRIVLNLSNFAAAYWWILFLLIIIATLVIKYLMQFDRFNYRLDVVKMKFPFIGVLVHKGALVRMLQTLSTLFNSSVPILQSVEITEKVVDNKVIQGILAKSRQSLAVGESLTKPMKDHWAFPALVVQMVQIGEKTGTLDHMLMKAAEFYEEEVEQLSNRIKVLIEPLMIIVLTVIVGSIIMAVVIPMFSLFEKI
ncbi:type II secretion system F family protein [Virgibacillus sp. DJP39]|uniref:type II secretion system F family protein n=1 Tax=Virgibacillus sp. DJP39 TaxID=3409790 RepID=UPI003BB58F21